MQSGHGKPSLFRHHRGPAAHSHVRRLPTRRLIADVASFLVRRGVGRKPHAGRSLAIRQREAAGIGDSAGPFGEPSAAHRRPL